jgi:hypothetical protein
MRSVPYGVKDAGHRDADYRRKKHDRLRSRVVPVRLRSRLTRERQLDILSA